MVSFSYNKSILEPPPWVTNSIEPSAERYVGLFPCPGGAVSNMRLPEGILKLACRASVAEVWKVTWILRPLLSLYSTSVN